MFASIRGRNRHYETVHLKLKRHTCKLCVQRFGQKVSLKRHLRNVHGIPGADLNVFISSEENCIDWCIFVYLPAKSYYTCNPEWSCSYFICICFYTWVYVSFKMGKNSIATTWLHKECILEPEILVIRNIKSLVRRCDCSLENLESSVLLFVKTASRFLLRTSQNIGFEILGNQSNRRIQDCMLRISDASIVHIERRKRKTLCFWNEAPKRIF